MASSGTITSTPHSSNGAYWSFEWTATPSSTKGKTVVSYNIYRRGRSSSPTWLATDCNITVHYNGTSFSALSTGRRTPGSSSDNGTSFKNVKETSGSFTVTHSSNGSGSFTVEIAAYIDPGYNWEKNCFGSGTGVLDTNYAYTRCTSPTSVSASGIVAPNGNVTVSWSGASGGVSNPISNYRVYWKISSNGSAPSSSDNSGYQDFPASNSQGVITLNNATRGHKIVFGVQSIGSVAGYDAVTTTTGGNVIVNTLPTKPTVSGAPTLIPSTGGTVNFILIPGSDIDNQGLSFRYSTSLSGEKQICGSNLSLNITKGATYYFWTYDGVEDSNEYESITIVSNTKPTLSITSSGTQLESENIGSNQKYVINPKITLSRGNNGQQNNSYNFYMYYSLNQSSWQKLTLSERQQTLEKLITDVRSLNLDIEYENTGFYYYFAAQRYDGLEWSDEIKDTNIYYVTKTPQLLNVYNTGEFSNIQNIEFQDYFSKVLSFTFERDQGYNSLEIYNNGELIATVPLELYVNSIRGKWQNINLTKGTYNFQVKVGKTESEYYSNYSNLPVLYKIANLEAKNLNLAQDTFEVYVPNLVYNYNLYNTFNAQFSQLNEEIYKQYGILNIENSFYAKINIGDKYGKTQSLEILSKTDRDTLYFNLTSEQLYNMLPEVENKNLTYDSVFTVGFVDIFNEKIEVSKALKINYAALSEYANISLKVDGKEEANTWPYLKEGMPLTLSGTIKTYNSKPKVQLLITRIKGSSNAEYTNFGNLIDLSMNSTSISGSSPAPGEPIIFTFNNVHIATIGTILELEYEVNFKILISTEATNYSTTSEELYLKNIKVRGHSSQGAVTLTDIDFSTVSAQGSNSILKFKYNNTHPGAVTELTSGYIFNLYARIQYRNISIKDYSDNNLIDININNLESYLSKTNEINNIEFNFPESTDALVCRLVLYTTQSVIHSNGDIYTTTYIVYSNEQALYNILPTVSYRKNLLGINSSNLENYNNAVLVIGEHSSKDVIYFISSSGIKTIKTSTGELDGFIINSGTWD